MGIKLSKNDMKIIATSGGMIAGGHVATSASGDGGPVGMAGTATKMTGMLGLSYVGAHETLEMMGLGSKVQMMKYGQDAKRMGGAISSSARRAAPRLKLLAGKIAQGANQII
jgi:hypothetical protein